MPCAECESLLSSSREESCTDPGTPGFCSPAHLGPFVFVMSSPVQHPRPRLKGRLCAPSNPSKPNTSHRPPNTGALFFMPVAQDLSSNMDYFSHFLLDSILSDRNWRNQKGKLLSFVLENGATTCSWSVVEAKWGHPPGTGPPPNEEWPQEPWQR